MQRTSSFLALISIVAIFSIEACSSGGDDKGKSSGGKKKDKKEKKDETPESIKEGKGIGPVTDLQVKDEINADWAEVGEAIHGKKCAACHKLTDKRVTGPGWAGITNKRKPEWIMNMIMNTDVMLAQDPEAQKQLEECGARMPNQNLSRDEARKVLEFMRQNDLDQVGEKDKAMEG